MKKSNSCAVIVFNQLNKTYLLINESISWDNRVFISGSAPNSPPRKIKNWTNRIKNTFLHKINDITITSPQQVKEIIENLRHQKNKKLTITVSVNDKRPIQHEEGIPILYYDQLSHIADLLHNIKYDTTTEQHLPDNNTNENPTTRIATLFKMIESYTKYGNINIAKGILPKKKRRGHRLTRRKCKSDNKLGNIIRVVGKRTVIKFGFNRINYKKYFYPVKGEYLDLKHCINFFRCFLW